MMKKCCFIIPYYGQLPNYFNVFLKTCEMNKNFDWMIFTDDQNNYNCPDNVKIIYDTIENFKKNAEEKLGFKVSIPNAHKICDFKPAFGFLYESYIKDYYMWGHCDLDIILGNLDKFITDDLIKKYDKLFCLGHMILYKNNEENNRMFMKKYNNKELYKSVFTNKKTLIFDETYNGKNNINSIFELYRKKIYTEDLAFNVKIFPTKFTRSKFIYQKYDYENENIKNAIYVWDKGNLYRIIKNGKEILREDFMYMHFQQRKMSINNKVLKDSFFQIVPNRFETLKTNDITINNFNKCKKYSFTLHYLTKHIEWKLSKWRKKNVK